MTLIGVTLAAGADARRDGRSADRGPWAGPAATTSAEGRAQVLGAYARLPLAFVENRGQTHGRVRYYAQGSRYSFALTREGVVLSLVKGTPDAARGVNLAWRFVGGNPHVRLQAQGRLTGTVNYLRGNDPARWQTGLARHAQVRYRELWPGVDLRCAARPGR